MRETTSRAKPTFRLERAWLVPAHHQAYVLKGDGAHCYAAIRHSRLVKFDVATGAELWAAKIEHPWGWLAVGPQYVFYLNQRSSLMAFDRETGERLWTKPYDGYNGWLHALGDVVVMGGWRGYAPVAAFEAATGRAAWTRPPGDVAPHRTAVHYKSGALLIAERPGRLVVCDLRTGHDIDSMTFDDDWPRDFDRHSLGDTGAPVLIRLGENKAVLVEGDAPSISLHTLPPSVWSVDLVCRNGNVAYIGGGKGTTQHLRIWRPADGSVEDLGHITHGRADLLPFACYEDATAVGTTTGSLRLYAGGRCADKIQCGKRVWTQIHRHGEMLVFGTASGAVCGIRIVRG